MFSSIMLRLSVFALVVSFNLLLPSILLTNDVHASEPTVDFGLRTRWETAEFGDTQAHALTLKGRVNINYSISANVTTFLQVDHVSSFNADKYSDVVLITEKQIIADPANTELNQFFIKNSYKETDITLGRQRLVLGEQRFVGDVGFRQNDQTYDGILLNKSLFSASTLKFAYLNNVNRIFGNEAGPHLLTMDTRFAALNGLRPVGQLGNHHIDGAIVHLNVNEWDHMELSLFTISIHNFHAYALSNQTSGVNLGYRNKFGDIKTKASIEVASQNQQAVNTSGISYLKISATVEVKSIEFGLRHELLAEKEGVAFITPLATLHKFQGWADQFLSTPKAGLRDNSIHAKWTKRPWIIDVRYHQFNTDLGNTSIAEELDIDIIYKHSRDQEIKLRVALFDVDVNQTIKTKDVQKVFLMYSYKI